MDHLPKPLDPILAYPSIPYVCMDEYDCQDFSSYPVRAGWSDDEVSNSETWTELGKEGHRSFADAKSFLQTWLYFGSLHAFYGNLVKSDDFIEKHSFKPPSIHTRSLMHVTRELIRHVEHQPLDRHALSALDRVMILAHNTYKTVSGHCALEPNFILSIGFLLDFLSSLHGSLSVKCLDTFGFRLIFKFGVPIVSQNEPSNTLGDYNGKVDFLDVQFAASGWCPRLVCKLRAEKLSFRYYALYLGPPDDQRDHGSCTIAHCNAYQTDKRRYLHRHAEEQCNCKHVEVDLEETCSTLQSGHIPLISTEEPTKKEYATVLNTSLPSTKYVAISHVWSDGLGNPLRNSIARCQMRKICKAVRSLPNSSDISAFWLDTLCCPIEPKELKTFAIRKMRDTYQYADAVLVLDSELEKLSLAETPLIDIAVRIFTSGWAGRLWTWQEGALSSKLYILLSDGSLNFEHLFRFIDEHLASVSSVHHSGILAGILNTYVLVRGTVNRCEAAITTALDITDIESAVCTRTTSVADDEAICIGAMMNLDLQSILDAEPEDRMCAFWRQCPSLPIHILFSSAPRLAMPGLRWAPPSLLNNQDNLFHNSSEVGKPTSRGLRLRCRGFLLVDSVGRPISDPFWLLDSSGGRPFFISKEINDRKAFQAPTRDDEQTAYTHAALVVKEYITAGSPSSCTSAALVYVYANTHSVLYARRAMSVIVHLTDHPFADVPRQKEVKNTVMDPKIKVAETYGHRITIDGVCHALEYRTLSDDQEWCID